MAYIAFLEADEIVPGLYQGSIPPDGGILHDSGISAVVLCAKEWQPAAKLFKGVDVIHAPNDDDRKRDPTRQELRTAIRAAQDVARRLDSGQSVLVTCKAGLNRSGLVSALALHFWKGWSGVECASLVQRKRPNALFNQGFVRVLHRLPEKSR